MTIIALTCQNRREITEHAGQCRNFLVYRIDDGEISPPQLLELPREASLHHWSGDTPHALDGIDVLISASMGDGLRHKLARRGIRTLLTSERDPLLAVQGLLHGPLPPLPEAGANGDEHSRKDGQVHGHGHGHGQSGCGHCNCRH